MAFFGSPARDLHDSDAQEDVPVFTWGDDSYDGLGDALQEGGDDMNDETFGGGPVGKDFDFSGTAGLQPSRSQPSNVPLHSQPPPSHFSDNTHTPAQKQDPRSDRPAPAARTAQSSAQPQQPSVSSIWEDQSAFSVLPRRNGSARVGDYARSSPAPAATTYGIPNASVAAQPLPGRTLQDIEAEMWERQRIARQQEQEKTEQERQQQAFLEQQRQQQLEHRQYQARQQHQHQHQQQLPIQQDQLLMEQLLRQEISLRDLQREETRERQRAHQEQQQRLQEQQLLREQQLQQARQEQARQEHVQRLLLLQQQQQQQQQLMREDAQGRTPPPRMMPTSQSPRFFDQQRQLLALQQQQELQQRQRLLELQEQLRAEELERRMAAASLDPRHDPHIAARRTPNYTAAELQAAQLLQQQQLKLQQLQPQQQQLQQQQQQQQYRRPSSRSPAIPGSPQYHPHDPATLQVQNHNLPLQQRLLADLAQNDFGRDSGASIAEQEAVREEAMRKIIEAEKMEEKRRRKAAKIAHMSRYNDLMTQSDKDFITRIQVSQLVTQDPYAEDFYAQVYGAILRSRMGLSQDERVLKFGSGGGIGLGVSSKGGNRRPSAMQRMEQQVERIVSNARKREEEKGVHAYNSLQGALGKTSGRSYKAAPRQLLQVDAAASASPTLSHAAAHISKPSVSHEGAAEEAAKLGREALGNAAATDGVPKKDPLTHRQALVILEELYELVLRIEQLRRDQPPQDDAETSEQWQAEYERLVEELWIKLRVMTAVDTSDPHPFISLLGPIKGKRILPRVTRHLDNSQMLTLLTLLIACFGQLDVVEKAPLLDTIKDTQERSDVERQTQAFLGSVMQSILPIVSVANLRLVSGLLGLLLDKTNIVAVAQTRPGLAILTLFLSRVEVIKQTIATAPEGTEIPTIEESTQWRIMFDHLFRCLAPSLVTLFPSSRLVYSEAPANPIQTDSIDQPVWQFLAALALGAGPEQHQVLVSTLREKILDNVLSVNKGWVHDEEERRAKLANVNLFLHALNLDSSQIAM